MDNEIINQLFTFSPFIIAIVPSVTGLVEVVKGWGIDSKWAPGISIVFGIGMMSLTGVIWQAVIAQGIIVGLAASGLYSGSDKISKEIKAAGK